MKTKLILFAFILSMIPALAQVRSVSVDTNGVLVAPTNFFRVNSNLLNQSVAGTNGGGGGGGTVPTGTGFVHITGGSQDAAAKTVDTADITIAAVTLSKLQSISTQNILGRSTSGSGAVESLSLASNLSAAAGVLDLTSTVSANARLAVNKNSGATVGTRRRLNLIEGSNITLTIADDSGNEEVDVTIAAAGSGSGTVTSVAANLVDMIVSGSPITGAGTISTTWSNQTQKTFLAGPTVGSPATPTWRTIATGDLGGGSASGTTILHGDLSWSKVNGSDLNSGVGTTALDQISSTRGTVLYRGAAAWSGLTPGTSGLFLQSQGAGADPLYAAAVTAAAGSNNEVQWRNPTNGAFASASEFSWDNTNKVLNVGPSSTAGRIDVYDANSNIVVSVLGGSGIINSNNTASRLVATDSTNRYVSTITAANLRSSVTGTTGTGNLAFDTDMIISGSFQLPNGAAPTTDVFGELAGDNNAWASGRGALQFFDGTANTYIVGALASDTPSNGQVPTWNTGGTITWETPSTASGTVTATGGSLTANAVVLGAGTTDTKVVAGITTDGTSKLTLGVAGTSVGTIDFKNATSGTITVTPPTGALGNPVLTLPTTTGTLALTSQITGGGLPTNGFGTTITSSNAVNAYQNPTTTTSGTTLTIDVAAQKTFWVTVTNNFVMAAPSNPQPGMTIKVYFAQDSTGGWTVTLTNGISGGFMFFDDIGTPILSTTANYVDTMTCTYMTNTSPRWMVDSFIRGAH